jgi:hypothetical protein
VKVISTQSTNTEIRNEIKIEHEGKEYTAVLWFGEYGSVEEWYDEAGHHIKDLEEWQYDLDLSELMGF